MDAILQAAAANEGHRCKACGHPGPYVGLTDYEYGEAVAVGRARHARMKERKCQDNDGVNSRTSAQRLADDIFEALCERALWKWFGALYPFERLLAEGPTQERPDCCGCDVKGRREPWHDLIVKGKIPDGRRVVLLTAHNHSDRLFRVRGFYWSQECKQPKFVHKQFPTQFLVPQNLMHPLDTEEVWADVAENLRGH